ncbi:MAG: hypothetical protein AAF726_03625 [Planctomycetota bacterium]
MVRSLLLASLGPALAADGSAQGYFFTVPIPAGGIDSFAAACSADGSVVAGCYETTGPPQAFRYDVRTGTRLLGHLPGGAVSCATGVSGDGTVVVGSADATGTFATSIAWRASAAPVDLGVEPGLFFPSAGAFAASEDGSFIAGKDVGYVYWWSAATGRFEMTDMFAANAITADGQRVFGRESGAPSGAGRGAASWSLGQGVVPLAPLLSPLANITEATGCTPDGSVAVGFATFSSPMGDRSLVWAGGGPPQVLPLSSGAAMTDDSRASDVSADGQCVVGRERPIGGPEQAMLWSPSTGTVLLRDYLLTLGMTEVTPFDLERATAVSDDGTVIVGLGQPRSNPLERIGFIVYLDAPGFALGQAECVDSPPSSAGAGARLLAIGSDAAADNDVTLVAQRLPEGAIGTFLCSRTAGFAVAPGGIQGTLCLGGSIGRFTGPNEIFVAQGEGEARLRLDLTRLPQPSTTASVLPGETWRFQAWFRETGPAAASFFTSSVAWTAR